MIGYISWPPSALGGWLATPVHCQNQPQFLPLRIPIQPEPPRNPSQKEEKKKKKENSKSMIRSKRSYLGIGLLGARRRCKGRPRLAVREASVVSTSVSHGSAHQRHIQNGPVRISRYTGELSYTGDLHVSCNLPPQREWSGLSYAVLSPVVRETFQPLPTSRRRLGP